MIGVPHPGAEPALAMLKREGFRFHGYVDIFDAGPTLDAHIDDLLAVRNSVTAPIETRSMSPGGGARRSWSAPAASGASARSLRAA